MHLLCNDYPNLRDPFRLFRHQMLHRINRYLKNGAFTKNVHVSVDTHKRGKTEITVTTDAGYILICKGRSIVNT